LKYLLDTCVISELIKERKERKVVEWIQSQNENSLFISVLTIGEIHKGITKLPDSQRKAFISDWVDHHLKKRFAGRIIKIDEEIATYWGEIQGKSEKEGKKMPVIDSLIAATAIKNDLIVVTRNIKDIKNSGCKSTNPWE